MHTPLTWSLVIPTYMRAHILPQCLRLAATQTRPPQEVIVVDASPNWQDTRASICAEFEESFPDIKLTYQQARCPSSTIQRNQGVDLATSDVLFLIDDDSLMYPDCAEEIMKVYEADVNEKVLGVSAMHAPEPPSARGSIETVDIGASTEVHPQQTLVRRIFKALLNTQATQFLPYDGEFPCHDVPGELGGVNIGVIPFMTGSSMTFRKKVFETERFNEILQRYAAGEDQDLSYRVSRHGLIVNAIDAQLCHLGIGGGRLSTKIVTVLAALNPAVLQQFHSCDLTIINRRWSAILRRLLLINFLKDLSARDFSFMTTRGVALAIKTLPQIQRRSGDDLIAWYQQFQATLLESKAQ